MTVQCLDCGAVCRADVDGYLWDRAVWNSERKEYVEHQHWCRQLQERLEREAAVSKS